MQFFIATNSIFLQSFFAICLTTFLIEFLRTKELPPRLLRWGLFVSCFFLIARGIVYSIEQYRAWSGNPFTRHFLPPENTAYFVRYTIFHFFSGFFWSFIMAMLLLGVFYGLQRYSGGKWLDASERLLVFFGALAASWPGAILYAVGVFVLPLAATPWLLQTSETRSPESGERVSPDHRRRVRLAPFIILSAFLAMVATPFILPYAPWLDVLVCRTCI